MYNVNIAAMYVRTVFPKNKTSLHRLKWWMCHAVINVMLLHGSKFVQH